MKKIILSSALIMVFSHTAERNSHLSNPQLENSSDVSKNKHHLPAQVSAPVNHRANQSSMLAKFSAATLTPLPLERQPNKKYKMLHADNPKKIILEGYEFDTSLSPTENGKILRKMILEKRNKKKYHCCLPETAPAMTWQELAEHVRQTHRFEDRVVCPHCHEAKNTNQLGYEHIAWHEHKDLFRCPAHCSKDNPEQDSLDNLCVHFKYCLYKIDQPKIKPSVRRKRKQKDAGHNSIEIGMQEIAQSTTHNNHNNTNQVIAQQAHGNEIAIDDDSKTHSEAEEHPEVQLIRYQDPLLFKENTRAPMGQTRTLAVLEINKPIKLLHQRCIDGFKQYFTTWFGILNYINDTRCGNLFMCPKCNVSYGQSHGAASCYLKHWDKNIFTCKKCNNAFSTFSAYKLHVENKCTSRMQAIAAMNSLTQQQNPHLNNEIEYTDLSSHELSVSSYETPQGINYILSGTQLLPVEIDDQSQLVTQIPSCQDLFLHEEETTEMFESAPLVTQAVSTLHNPVFEVQSTTNDYFYNLGLSTPGGHLQDQDDPYMAGSVTNDIIDSSITEYHEYYQH